MSDDLFLVVLCSPSGAGKTTLTQHLLQEFPNFTFSVSHTTRKPRHNEQDGVHYNFVTREQFEEKERSGRFIEWAEVHGNLYGTSFAEFDRARAEGRNGIVFDIDYQGARQIRSKVQNTIGIFILPPSLPILRSRLQSRATDAEEVIERRYQKAMEEIEHYGFFDYLVVNDDLNAAKRTVSSVVNAEMHKRFRIAPFAEKLLRTQNR